MRTSVPGASGWEGIVGPCVHIAGTTATQNGVVLHPGDAAAQTRAVLRIIGGALREVGAELRQVVRTRIYVTDISQWEARGRAHGEVFADIWPACTMLQVAALIDPAQLVEIEADAYLE